MSYIRVWYDDAFHTLVMINAMLTSSASPSYKPLYEQIKTLITQSLIGGEWRPSEVIPSEFELAKRFNVSQGTVRKAVDALASENILIRRQGKGTYVATHDADAIKRRFLRLTAVSGEKETLQQQFLSCEKSKADTLIAKALNLKENAATIVVRRLLTFSGRPLIYDCIAVSALPFKGLSESTVVESHGSMYRMYESQFNVRMVRAEERIQAVGASEEVASALGLEQGFPLLKIERVSYTYDNKPMEWRLGFCLTDDHHYNSEIE